MTRRPYQKGFALPSIIITSVVMFTIVSALVGSISSIKVSLDGQYYRGLARDAAESGANYAKTCLYEPTFVQGDTINPSQTCKKTTSGMGLYLVNNSGAATSSKFRTTYSAELKAATNDGKRIVVTGKVELLRTSNNTVWKTYTWVTNVQVTKKIDPEGDRASKRFWYFGQFAGLDFGKTGNALATPIAYTVDSSITNPYGANEGATVTNDQNGNFLFWSNGLQIWDKSGKYMRDDTGTPDPLLGDDSVSQGGISFPFNSSRTRYGVVTNTSTWEHGQGQLYLHTIDMTRNGGNGAIIEKNIPLTTALGNYSGEAAGAMPNEDGSGYYIYTFNTDPDPAKAKITRFLIKLDGTISSYAQFSFPNNPRTCQSPRNNGMYGFGGINFNKDYSKVLFTAGAYNCSYGTNRNGNDKYSGAVYMYDTNRSSGALSHVANWTVENDFKPFDYPEYAQTIQYARQGLYEAEFSPSERFVYTTTKFPGRLTRYDVSSRNSSNIKASQWSVPAYLTNLRDADMDVGDQPFDMRSGGHIRTGPDGRMYIADPAYSVALLGGAPRPGPYKMSYIENPDAVTPSVTDIGLNIDAITLVDDNGKYTQSGQSLPQTVTVYVPEIIIF